MNKAELEQSILNQLERMLSIVDVYFHKGVLYVINDYDFEAVEEFMDETGYAADVDFRPVNELA